MTNIRGLFMKRSVAILCIAIVVFAIFSGCTKKEADSTVRLRFVTWKPNQPEVWHEIIDIFQRKNPGIEIVREIGPHSSTAFHDLLTQKLKNKSKDVDVFFMDVVWPPEFAAAGWAMVLDDVFTTKERVAFLPGTILANTYQERIYGVPLFIDSGVLYYRKDLLAAYGFRPPRTWKELVSQAEKIVGAEAKTGNAIVGFTGQFKQYEGLVCNMMEYILSNN
jgi:multiple sugar transport system substrate-binding protein